MTAGLLPLIWGATAMGCVAVATFFFRFYRERHDRLFLFFGIGFLVLAANRVGLALVPLADESRPYLYALRLVAFALIAFAVIDKNRKAG